MAVLEQLHTTELSPEQIRDLERLSDAMEMVLAGHHDHAVRLELTLLCNEIDSIIDDAS